MKLILLALALVVQEPTPQPQQPLPSDGPPPRELTPGNDLFYEDSRPPTPEARAAMDVYARCVIRNSRELAVQTLRDDFTSQRYRSSLRSLSRNNEGCFRQSGSMRATGLMFAGALAEALLEENATPINVRLAQAAAGPPTPFFSPTDRIAVCTVRSVPDQVAALLASEPGGAGEQAAVAELNPVIRLCAQGNAQVRATPPGVRAMLATAAFRTIANEPGGNSAAATQNGSRN